MSDRITFAQYRIHVIRPTLAELRLPSAEAAEALLLGTVAQETELARLAQSPSGPARGFFQIEPGCFDDLFKNFLNSRIDLRDRALEFAVPHCDLFDQVTWNLRFAAAIARLVYYRAPDYLPDATDLPGLAAFYKRHWNTAAGKATEAEFIENFNRYIGES